MAQPKAMLDAHVRFEMERLAGPGLDESVHEEVDALFGWLRSVRLGEIAPAGEAAAAIGQLAAEASVTDELIGLLGEFVAGIHRVVLEEEGAVEDLLRQEDYDGLVAVLAGMEDARHEILDILTTSEAYTKLVAHVLYHGVKSYVLTENLLARKIPGASRLVRLGQRGLTSAAPKLEAGVDRQLLAFVQANIADTLGESRRYLDEMLDEEVLMSMAQEIWQNDAGRTVASVAVLAEPEQVAELVRQSGSIWEYLRTSGTLQQSVQAGVEHVLRRHSGRSVGEILTGLGVTKEAVATHVLAIIRPGIDHAREAGYLESRIRHRLEAFYSSYEPGTTPKRRPPAR